MDAVRFDALFAKVEVYLVTRQIFVRDCYAGVDERVGVPIRIVTELAWHDLFLRNTLGSRKNGRQAQFTIIDLPNFHGAVNGDECFTVIDWFRGVAVIAGNDSPAAIRRCVMTIVNYFFPHRDILSLFSSASIGDCSGTDLFLGTPHCLDLVPDAESVWIGSDVHAWARNGISKIECGCYCDVGSLQKVEGEALSGALHQFGALVENLPMTAETREFKFEQWRACGGRVALPHDLLNDIQSLCEAPHPKNVFIVLTDEFGVLPPIAKLTLDQTLYYFLSGPLERAEPCFSAIGLPLWPTIYLELLRQYLQKYKPECWLLNVGFIGATHRSVPLDLGRRMIQNAIDGTLSGESVRLMPLFRLAVPTQCADLIPDELNAATYWPNTETYATQVRALADRLKRNFRQFDGIDKSIKMAGPV